MSGKIMICDLKRKTERYHTEILRAFTRVTESGWFVLGPEVSRFEKSFSEYIGVNNCCTVANGTDAIELALRAAGIQDGDQVGTVANACMYTTTALMAIGAEPVFLDVGLGTKVITVSEIERAIAKKVRAVVVTHLYGQAIREVEIMSSLCRQAGVLLIEDCAQAHGAMIGGRRVGSFGDLACFSFYPTKNLGALGDGGAVVTNNPKLAEKVFRLRQYGWLAKYNVVSGDGRNSRLDELQAAVLTEFLPFLNGWNLRRRQIAQRYAKEIFAPGIILPEVDGEDYVSHLFVVRAKNRDFFRAHLHACGVSTEVHYPVPDYRQPVFGTRFSDILLDNSELLANEVVTLPCYPEMSDGEVEQVVEAVNLWQG
ncbi:MAG: DegT/DnrJ/EryC1/StrS family aminotransferase [Firmicutes bacterium]|nr:DegT/DnrJ/EryC1/StrS family aminotransferase [Bacillota bacterium]